MSGGIVHAPAKAKVGPHEAVVPLTRCATTQLERRIRAGLVTRPARTPVHARPAEPGDAVQHDDQCPANDHGACLCGLMGAPA